MSSSLARSVRITNAKEFAHVFNKGRHSQSQFWKIVISHLKRLARETFRLNQDCLGDLDYVVMAKKNDCNNNAEVMLDLLSLMKKAKNRIAPE